MTPQDIAAVVGLLAVAFGRDVAVETFDVYEAALYDLDVEDPRGLVLELVKTAERWPTPAAIRRAVLEAAGQLPPTEAQAKAQLAAYVSNPVGAEGVHPLVKRAVRLMGGTGVARLGDATTVAAQFRDTYRALAADETARSMRGNWKGVALGPASQLQLEHGESNARGEVPGEGG